MKKHVLYWLAVGLFILVACQKETSFELGDTPGAGSLQSDASGDCLPKTVSGTYIAGTALVPNVSTLTVSVMVTQTGTYTISTDTVNGYFFRASGTFTTLGQTNIVLQSSGTPFAAGVNNFVVSYGTSICDIQVTVLPAGAGAAVYTINCPGVTVQGTYQVGVALTAANTITIPVTAVTTPGTYTITGTINGMTFSGSGNITAPGNIILNGTGTPTAAASPTSSLVLTTPSCTIPITVAAASAPAVYTINCAGVTVQGTYQVGVALTGSNTITIPVTAVTTPGSYTITGSINGMTFSGSGNLTAPGNIILTGTGTPTPAASPTSNLVLTSPSCTIPITVAAAAGPAVYTINCAGVTVQGTYQVGVALTGSNTITIPVTAVSTPGSYTISGSINGMTFSASGNISAPGNIILAGTGTPTAAASPVSNLVLTSPSCTIPINVAAALSNDYFPRTTNSNWSYEWNDNALDSFYRTVIAPTHMAAGNTFNIFMLEDDGAAPMDSSGYYRRSGGDYFEWFDYGTWLGLDNPGWGEYIMLKDNVAAGTNWKTGTFNGTVSGGTPIQVRFSYTLLQKDVAVSITTSTGTVNYVNVNVVEEKIEVFDNTSMSWQDVTVLIDYFGKSYYARGIGLIKFEAYDGSGVLTDYQELRRRVVF